MIGKIKAQYLQVKGNMTELLNRGDYQLQDESLQQEIEGEDSQVTPLDKLYLKSILIAYVEDVIIKMPSPSQTSP